MNIKIIIIGAVFCTDLAAMDLKHRDIVELIKNNKVSLDQNIPYDGDNYRVIMYRKVDNYVQYRLEKPVALCKINIGTDFISADESTNPHYANIERKRIYNNTYQSFITSLGLATVASVSIASIFLGFHWMIKDLLKNQKN